MEDEPKSDVDQALAAIGSATLPYRTFGDAAPATNGAAAASIASTFPLLALALPEIADQQVRLGVAARVPDLPADEARPDPVSARIAESDFAAPAPASPAALTPDPTSTATSPGAAALAPTIARQQSVDDLPPQHGDSETLLTSVFRLLRGSSQPPPQPGKARLDTLFRRL